MVPCLDYTALRRPLDCTAPRSLEPEVPHMSREVDCTPPHPLERILPHSLFGRPLHFLARTALLGSGSQPAKRTRATLTEAEAGLTSLKGAPDALEVAPDDLLEVPLDALAAWPSELAEVLDEPAAEHAWVMEAQLAQAAAQTLGVAARTLDAKAAQSQDAGGTHNAAAGTADAQGANAVAAAGLSSGATSAQAEAVAPRSAQAGAEAVVDDGPKGRAREVLQGEMVQGGTVHGTHGMVETHATRNLRDGNGVEAAQATHARSIPTAADIGPCDGTHWSTSHSRTGAAEHARHWVHARRS